MLRALAVLLGALWLAGCGAPASPAREWPAPSPALWEATAPGGERGWLFGTIHALPDGVDWRTPRFEESFAQAGVLVIEIAELDNSAAAAEAFEAMAYSPGQRPFHRRWGEDFNAAAEQAIDRARINSATLDPMEDWAAALTLAGGLRLGDPANGVDRALLASGKPRIGLETFASQLAVFDSLDEAAQGALLQAVVMEEARRDPAAGIAAWLAGDVAELSAMARTGILANGDLRAALLVDRNRAWLPRIAALVEEGRAPFVAVGAAHLLGEDGLVAGLEARGYSLRRIQ